MTVFDIRHRRRRRRIADIADSPAKRYYQGSRFDPDIAWTAARYLVLDVETSGLDPDHDYLLSAGWVCVDDGAMSARSARHHLIRPPHGVEVGDSAAIHHITDTEVGQGASSVSVVEMLFDDLCGRVLVCHYARLELGFVGAVLRREWGVDFWPRQLIDTMQWHADRASRMMTPIAADDLRLHSLLHRYGLPRTQPHHALSDAYGTALVLMAMAGDIDRGRGIPSLGQLLDQRSW